MFRFLSQTSYKVSIVLICLITSSVSLTVVADQIRYMDKAGNIIFVDKIADVPDQYRDQVIKPTPIPVLSKQQINEMKRKQREQEDEIKRKELEREKAKIKHDKEVARLREKQEKELKKSDPTRQLEKVDRR